MKVKFNIGKIPAKTFGLSHEVNPQALLEEPEDHPFVLVVGEDHDVFNYIGFSQQELSALPHTRGGKPYFVVNHKATAGRFIMTSSGTFGCYLPSENAIYFEGTRHAFKEHFPVLAQYCEEGKVDYQYLMTNCPKDMMPHETRDEYLSRYYAVDSDVIELIRMRIIRDHANTEGAMDKVLETTLLAEKLAFFANSGYYTSLTKEDINNYKRVINGQILNASQASSIRAKYFNGERPLGIVTVLSDLFNYEQLEALANFPSWSLKELTQIVPAICREIIDRNGKTVTLFYMANYDCRYQAPANQRLPLNEIVRVLSHHRPAQGAAFVVANHFMDVYRNYASNDNESFVSRFPPFLKDVNVPWLETSGRLDGRDMYYCFNDGSCVWVSVAFVFPFNNKDSLMAAFNQDVAEREAMQ